jgi:hypothetical protein
MNKKAWTLIALLVCALVAAVPRAAADTATYDLTIANAAINTAGYPDGTLFATVTLTLNGNAIDVEVKSTPDFAIGRVSSFGFNVVGSTAGLNVSNLTSGFTFNSGGANNVSEFGAFQFTINGSGSTSTSDLTFTVTRTGGFSSVSQLYSPNSDGYAFESHVLVLDSSGNIVTTGFVGNGPVTPEPASLALFGSGLVALGGVLRRRKKLAA